MRPAEWVMPNAPMNSVVPAGDLAGFWEGLGGAGVRQTAAEVRRRKRRRKRRRERWRRRFSAACGVAGASCSVPTHTHTHTHQPTAFFTPATLKANPDPKPPHLVPPRCHPQQQQRKSARNLNPVWFRGSYTLKTLNLTPNRRTL